MAADLDDLLSLQRAMKKKIRSPETFLSIEHSSFNFLETFTLLFIYSNNPFTCQNHTHPLISPFLNTEPINHCSKKKCIRIAEFYIKNLK